MAPAGPGRDTGNHGKCIYVVKKCPKRGVPPDFDREIVCTTWGTIHKASAEAATPFVGHVGISNCPQTGPRPAPAPTLWCPRWCIRFGRPGKGGPLLHTVDRLVIFVKPHLRGHLDAAVGEGPRCHLLSLFKLVPGKTCLYGILKLIHVFCQPVFFWST